jgi:sugar lactone lactonase YvrE
MKTLIFLLLSYPAVGLAQDIITCAGTNGTGYTGDGGPAVHAQLNMPYATAFDHAGNLLISDTWHYVVRKVDATGKISTIAGNGTSGYSGDGGAATSAQFSLISSIACDTNGNIYIADDWNNRIRMIGQDGVVVTIAGTGTGGFSGDNGPATAAQVNHPWGVGVDAAGNVYIADTWNLRVRMVDKRGIITTVAGNGTSGHAGDGGAPLDAQFADPSGLAFDQGNNIYVSDDYNHTIRKIAEGIITLVAGNNTNGDAGYGGPATAASLTQPYGMACDAAGILYFADFGTNRVCKVDASGNLIKVAGSGDGGFSGDYGPPLAAELYHPIGVAFSPQGNLYIADDWNSRVREITLGAATAVTPTPKLINSIEAFPNPVTDRLLINAQQNLGKVTIVNLLGQTVFSREFRAPKAEIDCRAFLPGTYIVSADDYMTIKIVKE